MKASKAKDYESRKSTMTPRGLRRKLQLLKDRPPITTAFEQALTKQGAWSSEKVRYKSQKDHWLGWLSEYDGPGFYGRKTGSRTAEYAYNHIVCPPMVLWLSEASGVDKSLVPQPSAQRSKLLRACRARAPKFVKLSRGQLSKRL
jgi:hypothetical protein